MVRRASDPPHQLIFPTLPQTPPPFLPSPSLLRVYMCTIMCYPIKHKCMVKKRSIPECWHEPFNAFLARIQNAKRPVFRIRSSGLLSANFFLQRPFACKYSSVLCALEHATLGRNVRTSVAGGSSCFLLHTSLEMACANRLCLHGL